jgi:hypothetical protein
MLLTRIVTCLKKGVPYEIRDLDGTVLTREEGKAIVAERFQVPPEIRAARLKISQQRSARRGRDERTGLDPL